MSGNQIKATARRKNKPAANVPMALQRADEDNSALAASYAAAEVYREHAVKLLLNELRTLQRKRNSEAGYDSPVWSHLQADCNGSIRTLSKVLRDVFGVEILNRLETLLTE